MSNHKKNDLLHEKMLEKQNDAMLTYIAQKLIEEDAAEVDRLIAEGKEFPMPEDVSKRLYQMIEKEKKRSQKEQRRTMFYKLSKVCTFIIVFSSIFSALMYNTVDAFRYQFDNFIATLQDDHVTLTPNAGNIIPPDWHNYGYPDYLPEGYQLKSAIESFGTKTLIFENNNGSEIQLVQQSAEGTNISIDSEGQRGTVKILDQYDGYWLQEESGPILLIWLQSDQVIQLMGYMSLEEAIKVAENLIYK